MQRGDSGAAQACTRMYTLETRGPFLRSYSLEKLENALENAPGFGIRTAKNKMVKSRREGLLEVYLRRTTGRNPSPVGTAIGDDLSCGPG